MEPCKHRLSQTDLFALFALGRFGLDARFGVLIGRGLPIARGPIAGGRPGSGVVKIAIEPTVIEIGGAFVGFVVAGIKSHEEMDHAAAIVLVHHAFLGCPALGFDVISRGLEGPGPIPAQVTADVILAGILASAEVLIPDFDNSIDHFLSLFLTFLHGAGLIAGAAILAQDFELFCRVGNGLGPALLSGL